MSNANSPTGSASDGNATKTKSTVAATSGGTTNEEQVSSQSKRAPKRRRINTRMVQNVLLIWLDGSIDETDADCRNTMMQLRRTVNNINTYTDGEECIQFLQTVDNEKVCLVISDSFSQHIVPRVHDMSQVNSIFILCDNTKRDEEWAKDWSKIKGVFTEISLICEALKQTARRCEHNDISMSFVATTDDLSNKKLDQLDPNFMYTQLLKEILLEIDFQPNHFTEFIEYCRDTFKDIPRELKNVNKLEKEYRNEKPIWWYTFDCFLYPMLNRSLRQMDANIMIKTGFFIKDLHQHIDELHQKQYANQKSAETFTVYRGQCMSTTEFDQMSKTKGGLMSFNSFLSTSKNQEAALRFADAALTNSELVNVLFVMNIEASQSTTPFASIKDFSDFEQEDEVLFAMHTVFRIINIKAIDGNQRLYQVDLILTNENDKDLRQLTDRIREETEGLTGWDRLGELLLKVGQPEKAEQVYNILLDQATEETQIAHICHRIGWAKRNLGEHREALTFYEKSLQIRQRVLPPNHPDLAKSYGNIGAVYRDMGEYSKALSSHEKALAIRAQSLPPNHPDLAMSYGNIGNVYANMGEYSKAVSSHEKALAIRQQSLPSNHPDLASSYNNIGRMYSDMGEYSKALSSHKKALEIREQSLPLNHPHLASSYNNIGAVYGAMDEYSKALSSHKKALKIREQSLTPNHPDLASSYNNIGAVYANIGEYSKALSSHEKALAIREQSLPPNHPDLASSYNNIGRVYANMGEYSKALSSHEKALAIREQSLPPNHPDVAKSYGSIGNVYYNMAEYSKARKFVERAIEIGKQSLPSDHLDIEVYRKKLDIIN